jgi:small subunit ribosomal protein S20
MLLFARADTAASWRASSPARIEATGNPSYQTEASYPGRGCRVANIKSQIKRNRQNEKRRLRNKSVKSSLKTAIRKFHEAADSGDTAKATELMRDASRKLDKAVSKGVIHRNQAANRKSAIAKRLQSLSA